MVIRLKIAGFFMISAALLHNCSTTPSAVDRSTLPECYCGKPVSDDNLCAVWPLEQNPKAPTGLIHSAIAETCDADVCREEFRDHCKTIRLWPHATKHSDWQPQGERCYCDLVWIDLGQGPEIACGAWSADHSGLIEYYSTDQCSPRDCGQPPFSLASRICPKGFKPFYRDR